MPPLGPSRAACVQPTAPFETIRIAQRQIMTATFGALLLGVCEAKSSLRGLHKSQRKIMSATSGAFPLGFCAAMCSPSVLAKIAKKSHECHLWGPLARRVCRQGLSFGAGTERSCSTFTHGATHQATLYHMLFKSNKIHHTSVAL